MKLKRIIVGFLAIMLAVGGLGIANVFQETEVTEAANGDDFATVTFRTTADYPFDDGTTERVVQVDLEAIETMELPLFESTDSASFVGWNLTSRFDALTTLHPNELVVGTTYSPATLLRQGFYAGDEAVFTAVTAAQGAEGSTDMYEYGQTTGSTSRVPSISTASPTSGNLIVYGYDGSSYTEFNRYTVSADNFRQALYDLYANGSPDVDYVLYVGGATGTVPSSVGNRTTTATSYADVSFYSLQNKIGSLTITGNTADNVTDTPATSAPATSVSNRLTFTAGTTLNFGTNVEIRNIWYGGVTNLAANGNSLYLGGGSWGDRAAYVFGGTSDGTAITATDDVAVTVSSTGSGTWNLYGGNNWGDFTGNSYLTINNTSGAINNVTGGSGANTFTGNTNVTIYNTSGAVANIKGGNDSYDVVGNTNIAIHNIGGNISGSIYGGQPGATITGNTSLKIYSLRNVQSIFGGTQSGTVNGNVSNFIRSTSSSFDITGTNTTTQGFFGGSATGTINGDISTLIAGYGQYSNTQFSGVGNSANVGSSTNRRQVTTILDTSLYTDGNFYYSGVNRVRGVVYADILNVTRAGRYNNGSITGYNGTSATLSSTLNQTGLGAAGVGQDTNLNSTDVDNGVYATTYDGYSAEQRRAIAESNATNRVYGNVTSHALGGSMSNAADQTGYMRAGGYGGYIEGDTSISTGIIYGAGQDARAGGYNFVRNQTTDISYYDNAANNIMQNFAYLVSGSGGGRTSLRTYSYGAFDIVGGTGEAEGERYGSYLYGDSSLTHNNVLARWTYGSNFGGVHEGNSTITLNGGLVDTLEGSGYRMVRHYGNSTAVMNNGEINFFFSGGGWGDWAMFGDVYAISNGGVINCAIGGTYGYQDSATSHYIFGNTNTVVTDGRFDGYPSHGYTGFSGGATHSGHIYGDVSLTLDL
ncbi:beta strand repeat-containing protein [Enterococcus sp. LJL90]